MWADMRTQIKLNSLHKDFMLSEYNEPLEYLRSINFPIEWRIKKYVKIWRENKQHINHLRKQKFIKDKNWDIEKEEKKKKFIFKKICNK